MCYYWGETGVYSNSELKSKPKELDFKILKTLVKDLTIVRPNYTLFGGEPFLYPFLEELIDEIKKAGSIIDTPTNGTLLAEHAEMLVKKKFDLIRVSIDGPREKNNKQRGFGSYEKAITGLTILYEAKQKLWSKYPLIDIIYTVTPENYSSIEQFFLHDIEISKLNRITIQMQNYITTEMGESYSKFLDSEFGIKSQSYWKGMVRNPSDFEKIDVSELSRQVNEVKKRYLSQSKNVMLLPPTFSPINLKAYLTAEWDKMTDIYQKCLVPWVAAEIVANGDVAPCHVFYDLVFGNLHRNNIMEIWNGKNYIKFRNYMVINHFMPICPGCCILYLAGKK
jgi:radical SAM protein with 4Fe4S-binding SPASM domain